ncbi:MAG: hypothetical protein AAFO15_01320 [Pseudomonadota bacterium]
MVLLIFILNIFEWYDYALYIVLKEYIDIYFLNATDSAWFVFAIGYFTRALGGVYFAVIARNNSNLYAISIATTIMLWCTMGIGILPSYNIVSYYGIYILRMLEGFALGGVMSLSIVTLLEYCRENSIFYNRGVLGSLPIASVPLGVLLANYIFDFFQLHIGYMDYWWRLPFFVSIIGLIFSSYLLSRSQVVRGLQISSNDLNFVLHVLYKSRFSIFLTLCIAGINGFGFYFITSYLIPNYFSAYNNMVYFFMSLMCVFGGYIGALYRNIVFYFIILISCSFVLFVYGFIHSLDVVIQIAGFALLVLVSMYIGIEPLYHTGLYESLYFRVAFAFAYNLSMFVFGGTTPQIILLWLNDNNIYYMLCYMVFVCLLSAFGVYYSKRIIDKR